MDKEIEIKKKKKKLGLYYGLLVTVICIIGVSFAWFRLYLSQTENNTIASRTCFNTTLTEDTSKISLTDAFPIIDEDGLKQTPFTFTIKNNCNSYVKVYITIDSTYRESTNTSYLKDNYMKVNISPKGTTTSKSVILGSQTLTDLENNRKGYIIVSTGLKANEEKSYDLKIWMDSAVTTEQGLNKNWSGKIVVVSNASNKPTFAETILANNEVKTPISTPGVAVSTNEEALLASTEDDYGKSYYFRGAVTNNYVEFANKCWRIVRITGNGAIKLVLHNDNTSSAKNPCSSTNNSSTAAFARYSGTTYKSKFNDSSDYNAYVGFMYGTTDISTAFTNTNKSTIMTNLETWYKNNLTEYESKLADTIWCNDKSISSGHGYGTDLTNYDVRIRLVSTKIPTLKCLDDNNGGKLSKFTVSDTTNGNGNLTYKIGLLTADEIAFSGSIYNTYNRSTYIYENTGTTVWWSLSPSYFGSNTYLWAISSGKLFYSYAGSVIGLRPSISLASNVEVTGSGTSEDPYVVK